MKVLPQPGTGQVKLASALLLLADAVLVAGVVTSGRSTRMYAACCSEGNGC